MRSLIITAIAALALAGAAVAVAAPHAVRPAPMCNVHTSKPCGRICIPKHRTCHAPGARHG